MRHIRVRVAFVATSMCFLLPAASSYAAPAETGFNSVLAVGQGSSVNGADLAANLATDKPPASFVDQLQQYSGISRSIDGLTNATLRSGWKDSSFREANEDAATTESPRAGVTIVRDAVHRFPRVYGATRSDVMFGAGYITAQDRLFLMDVLRHTAKASTVELLGASAVEGDADQLTHQDFSDAELQEQFDALPTKFGPFGTQGQQDFRDYADGINAYINEANRDPSEAARGVPGARHLAAAVEGDRLAGDRRSADRAVHLQRRR